MACWLKAHDIMRYETRCTFSCRTILTRNCDSTIPNPMVFVVLHPTQASQLQALLSIKEALVRNKELSSWTELNGANGKYCNSFVGVACDGSGNVVSILLPNRTTGGMFPPLDALLALPKLVTLNLNSTGISGTLPTDYGKLIQLEDVKLANNSIKGIIPLQWSKLSNLKKLHIS